MSDAHFFLPSVEGAALGIDGPEGHHAVRVLRLRPSETITASDGRGAVVRARVREASGDLLACDVVERWAVAPPTPRLTLWPAVAKNDKLDLVVQKATELGVAVIRPWLSERSVVRWDASKRQAHGERWRAIAYAAAKQSRSAWLPQVFDPVDGVEVGPEVVVLHESAEARLGDVMPPVDQLGVVIGPEGGLSAAEVEAMAAAGATVCSMGEQVMRAETASIAAVVALRAFKGSFGGFHHVPSNPDPGE